MIFEDGFDFKALDMIRTCTALARKGEYDNALKSFTSTLDKLRIMLPSNHPNRGDIFFGIGLIHKKQSNHEECILHLQNALEIYQNALGDRNWNKCAPNQKIDYYLRNRLFNVLSHLGSVSFACNDYNMAQEYFTKALTEAKTSAISALYIDRNFPLESGSVLKQARTHVTECLNNLASLCAKSDKRSAAISHYNEALALQIQELGEVDPGVAIILYNIGTMHYRSGQYNLALKSYRQVLKMLKSLFGSHHSSNAVVLLDIATTHEKLKEFEQAKSAFNAARTITTTLCGSKHVDIGRITYRIGAMHARQGEVVLALESIYRKYHIFLLSLYITPYDRVFNMHACIVALDVFEELGFDNSNEDVKRANDALHYLKGETDVSPFSKYDYILLKDKCSAFMTDKNIESIDRTISDDDRDDSDVDHHRLERT